MTSVVPSSSIKAIQTRYAGCHFRSRLEARWAVFFDTLGIQWEYEPQGFELEWRLSAGWGCEDSEPIKYLPDFWLPELGLWVEVKGSWTETECDRFLNAAACLSSGGAGGCRDAGDICADVVLLPNLPDKSPGRSDFLWRPIVLHMHKGDLIASAWNPLGETDVHDGRVIASDWGGDAYSAHGWDLGRVTKVLMEGYSHWFNPPGSSWASDGMGAWRQNPQIVIDAYIAARSARFEHGQSGAA